MEIKKDRFSKTITSHLTGQEYRIRRVAMHDYLQAIGILPVVIAQPVQERLKKLSEELKSRQDAAADPNSPDEKATREYLLRHGVVEPKIWFGQSAECPDDALAYEDMGDDAVFVVGEICAFWNQWQPDKFFPDAGTVAARPDGAEVRRETVQLDA